MSAKCQHEVIRFHTVFRPFSVVSVLNRPQITPLLKDLLDFLSTVIYNIFIKQIVYFSVNGKIPFLDWAESLDNSLRARIFQSLLKLQNGHLGDYKILAPNLYESRLFFGGGYRIYYTIQDGQVIIILCGGDKKTQKKDIAQAKKYLSMYLAGEQNDQKK